MQIRSYIFICVSLHSTACSKNQLCWHHHHQSAGEQGGKSTRSYWDVHVWLFQERLVLLRIGTHHEGWAQHHSALRQAAPSVVVQREECSHIYHISATAPSPPPLLKTKLKKQQVQCRLPACFEISINFSSFAACCQNLWEIPSGQTFVSPREKRSAV